jgi:hypothetical protein
VGGSALDSPSRPQPRGIGGDGGAEWLLSKGAFRQPSEGLQRTLQDRMVFCPELVGMLLTQLTHDGNLDAYEKAIEFDPDDVERLLRVGYIQIDRGYFDEVQMRLGRVLSLTTVNQPFYLYCGSASANPPRARKPRRRARILSSCM